MIKREALSSHITVTREHESPHERGGLGKEGWQRVIDVYNTKEHESALTQDIQKYATAVKEGELEDINFDHRNYLNHYDWHKVTELFKDTRQKKRRVKDITQKKLPLSLNTDIAYYAKLEKARSYTIDDYVFDSLIKKFDWDGSSWKRLQWQEKFQGYLDPRYPIPVTESIFNGSRDATTQDLKELKDIFLVDKTTYITANIPPEALYDHLRQKAIEEPTMVKNILLDHYPEKIDPWKDLIFPIKFNYARKTTTRALGKDLQTIYESHFGIKPKVTADKRVIALQPTEDSWDKRRKILNGSISTEDELPPLERPLFTKSLA